MENILLDLYNRKQSINNGINATVHLLCSIKLHVSFLKDYRKSNMKRFVRAQEKMKPCIFKCDNSYLNILELC